MNGQNSSGIRKVNAMNRTKTFITERALVARINRALAKERQALRRCRETSRGFHTLGRYYMLDVQLGFVLDVDVSIERLGRDLAVLNEREVLQVK